MSLLADFASSSSALLFGPPAPVSKDAPRPTNSKRLSASMAASPPSTPASRKAALLAPNLGLDDAHTSKMDTRTRAKVDDLPLPPTPEEASSSAPSLLYSTGATALSLLGSAVVGLSSVAVSALTSPSSDAEAAKAADSATTSTPKAVPPQQQGEAAKDAGTETMLGAISSAVLGRAASVRDAAIASVADAATSLASTAAHAVTDTAARLTSPTPGPVPGRASLDAAPSKHDAALHRSATFPVQYTASGEPFSSDPGISAMQRIPDYACGHNHARALAHCCSAPDVLVSVKEECSCKCFALTQSAGKDENVPSEQNQECPCPCHAKTAYQKGQSGHFHRVEQLVKGTKRVVRDIKNVL